MTVVVVSLLLIAVDTSGQRAKPAADKSAGRTAAAGKHTQTATDKRTACGAAKCALLGSGHVGTAHRAESQRTDKKCNY